MLDQPAKTLTAHDLEANLPEIQGGLLEEYDTLACAYVFYTLGSPEGGRSWLSALVGRTTTSAAARGEQSPDRTLNICFSAFGLQAIGIADET